MDHKATITFDPECVMPTCMHGYTESKNRIDNLESIITSQMGLLADSGVKKYDEVNIIDGDRLITLTKSDNKGCWDTDSTDKQIRTVHNWLNLWRTGEFKGTREFFTVPKPANEDSEFTGTPIECEAWLRERFDIMRLGIVGFTSVEKDGELVPGENQERALDAFDRGVWKVKLRALDMAATSKSRTSMMKRTGRIETERELFELCMKNSE